MHEFKDWKDFINRILIDSGQFEKPTYELKNETEIETFKSSNKNSLTEIRVGYLKKNLLIYLQIFNPTVPGYNKYVKGEYFYNNDFDEKKKPTEIGLEFDNLNRNGLLEILTDGLIGKEIQYFENKKVLKSVLDIYPEHFLMNYDFTGRNFFEKLFSGKIEKRSGIKSRVIELNTIFEGIKNVLQ